MQTTEWWLPRGKEGGKRAKWVKGVEYMAMEEKLDFKW